MSHSVLLVRNYVTSIDGYVDGSISSFPSMATALTHPLEVKATASNEELDPDEEEFINWAFPSLLSEIAFGI